METIMTLRQLRGNQRMEGVQIRLPQQIREVAKKIALEKSTKGQKVTETDIYRTAILIFLSNISTDSREIQE